MSIFLQYMRSVLFSFVVLPVFTLFTGVLIGLPFLLMRRSRFLGVIRFWVRGVHFLERYLLGLRYEVRGLEHVPKDGAFIIAAKHQSTYETFKLHLLFDDPAIILKKELLSIPLWGWYLAKSGMIAIDRSTPERAVVSVRDGAVEAVKQGRVLVIFPQGTRVRPHVSTAEKPYKPGVYRVHEATEAPVIPMALNSGVFWPRGSLLKKPGTVVFEFLPPIEAGLERRDFMACLEEALETRSDALAEEML